MGRYPSIHNEHRASGLALFFALFTQRRRSRSPKFVCAEFKRSRTFIAVPFVAEGHLAPVRQ
jgi:hypothetical protein